MTSEPAKPTEAWVEAQGAEYAYAYDKGGLMGKVGASGYPSAVLVNASGVITYVGHPGSINDSHIEQAIVGALPLPVWDWPKDAAKVKKAVLKKQMAKALDECEKLGEEHAAIKTAVRGVIDGSVAALENAKEIGDWLRVEEMTDALSKSLAGLPELDKVKEIEEALKSDDKAQEILKAQKWIQKTFSDRIKKGKIDKVEKELKEIQQDLPGTVAAVQASEGLKKLMEMKRR